MVALMRRLGREGRAGVLLEGGGTLAASMVACGMVDKVIGFIAPSLAGGRQTATPLGGDGALGMLKLKDVRWSRSGRDMRVEGYLVEVR